MRFHFSLITSPTVVYSILTVSREVVIAIFAEEKMPVASKARSQQQVCQAGNSTCVFKRVVELGYKFRQGLTKDGTSVTLQAVRVTHLHLGIELRESWNMEMELSAKTHEDTRRLAEVTVTMAGKWKKKKGANGEIG